LVFGLMASMLRWLLAFWQLALGAKSENPGHDADLQ